MKLKYPRTLQFEPSYRQNASGKWAGFFRFPFLAENSARLASKPQSLNAPTLPSFNAQRLKASKPQGLKASRPQSLKGLKGSKPQSLNASTPQSPQSLNA